MHQQNKELIVIGYSGHSYVVIDALQKTGWDIKGYCDYNQKESNPYKLNYLGKEGKHVLSDNNWIVAIGNNSIRRKIIEGLVNVGQLCTVIHPTASIGFQSTIGIGSFISSNVSLNALSTIGIGCIINTGSVIEHDTTIGDFSHVAPGAILCGNVSVGSDTLIGANSVIRENINIGHNVTIGAGAVIVNDVADNEVVVGNPGKSLLAGDS